MEICLRKNLGLLLVITEKAFDSLDYEFIMDVLETSCALLTEETLNNIFVQNEERGNVTQPQLSTHFVFRNLSLNTSLKNKPKIEETEIFNYRFLNP